MRNKKGETWCLCFLKVVALTKSGIDVVGLAWFRCRKIFFKKM